MKARKFWSTPKLGVDETFECGPWQRFVATEDAYDSTKTPNPGP